MVLETVQFIIHVSSDLSDIDWLESPIHFVSIHALELKDTELKVRITNPSIHVLEILTAVNVRSKPRIVSDDIEVFGSPPWLLAFPYGVLESKKKVPWTSASEVSAILWSCPPVVWICQIGKSSILNINKLIVLGY